MKTPLWYDLPREKSVTQMEFGDVPLLSLEERDRRWNELRKRMYINNIDVLIFFGNDSGYGRGMSNIRYITHFGDAHGGWVIFPLKGKVSIYSGPRHMSLPYSRYEALQNWVSDITYDCGPVGITDEIKKRELDKGRIGIISCSATGVSSELMPYSHMILLKENLADATFVDFNPVIADMRSIKSKEELAFLYKAAELARKKVDVMFSAMKVGNGECDMYADMVASDIKNGGEPQSFLLLSSGNVYDDDPGYKSLLHGASQPGSPTTRKFKEGDLAICEFHTQYGGYMAGCEFSIFLGNPPKELVAIHDACMESIDNAVATIKPGTTQKDALAAIRQPIIDRELDWIELGFHGHGLSSPEYPGSVYREEDDVASKVSEIPFEEDMIICLNIDVHNPNWRKDVGVMYGDMLHITKDGAKRLVNIPREFICK